MTHSLINNIISNVVLSSKPCSKLLESDGISSNIFILRDFDNKKLVGLKDVRPLRNNVPEFGKAVNIIKNLDEYLYIICNYVPNINDNNFFKIKFQKIRLLIYLFFNDFSKIISEHINMTGLDEWTRESNLLLVETSELVLEYRDSLKDERDAQPGRDSEQSVKLKRDYFNYFGMNEENMDATLYSIYGIAT